MNFRISPPMLRAAKRGPLISALSPRNWRSTSRPRAEDTLARDLAQRFFNLSAAIGVAVILLGVRGELFERRQAGDAFCQRGGHGRGFLQDRFDLGEAIAHRSPQRGGYHVGDARRVAA